MQVQVLTSSPNNKPEVTIDIEETASKLDVKQKLVSATGIPLDHQKVVLSGIGQLAVADKRQVSCFPAMLHCSLPSSEWSICLVLVASSL